MTAGLPATLKKVAFSRGEGGRGREAFLLSLPTMRKIPWILSVLCLCLNLSPCPCTSTGELSALHQCLDQAGALHRDWIRVGGRGRSRGRGRGRASRGGGGGPGGAGDCVAERGNAWDCRNTNLGAALQLRGGSTAALGESLLGACFGLRGARERAERQESRLGSGGDVGAEVAVWRGQILNVAAYRFMPMEADLQAMKNRVLAKCKEAGVLGTVLLAPEGINMFLASHGDATLRELVSYLTGGEGEVKWSWCDSQPFKRIKVKVKKEIIHMGIPSIQPGLARAPAVSSGTLRRWLDRGRDDKGREVVMLDTRNAFEMESGTFDNAVGLDINTFGEFPERVEAASHLFKNKTVVSFCTGGIRCEKAVCYMQEKGISDSVYQLDGGILRYFEEEGGKHYRGGCFVFDQRGVLDSRLREAKPPGFKLIDR